MNQLSTQPHGAERRTAVRVDVPLEATYSCNSPPVRARIQDLSEHGLFIDTNHGLSIGATLNIQFDLPDQGPAIQAEARVAWSAPMMGSGVQFLALSDEDRKRIKFFVAEIFFSTVVS